MKLFGFDITRQAPPQVEERQVHVSDELMAQLFGPSAGSMTGVSVTADTALGAATVFACVRALATTLSSLPLGIVKVTGSGAGVAAPEHQLNALLDVSPNPFMTPSDVIGAAEVWLALSGKAFIEVQRNMAGEPVGLYPIPNGRVFVNVDAEGAQVAYSVDGAPIDRRNVVHFRGLTLDGLNAINTTQKVREAIGLALVLQENAAKFFGNGSRPSAVLEHPAKLSKEAQERLKAAFEEQASGRNAYRTLVLEEGMKANFTRSENRDSQFIESRDRQDLEICRVFGMPPHKVGIMSGQPRANVEQENLSFVVDTIRPICTSMERELSRVLLTTDELAQGYRVRFNMGELLRGDVKSRYEAYALGRTHGWFSVNDIRTLENLPPVEGGDEYKLDGEKAGEIDEESEPKKEPKDDES